MLAAGAPALPVVDARERFAGIFGEREFIHAVFPGYFDALGSAGFVPTSLDVLLERGAPAAAELICDHMTTDHVEVGADPPTRSSPRSSSTTACSSSRRRGRQGGRHRDARGVLPRARRALPRAHHVKGNHGDTSRWTGNVARPLQQFLHTEAGSSSLLLLATVVALVWANSPLKDSYVDLWHTEATIGIGSSDITEDLRHWVNDGLMAFFFFVVGAGDPAGARRSASCAIARRARSRRSPRSAGWSSRRCSTSPSTPAARRAHGWGIVDGDRHRLRCSASLALVGPALPDRSCACSCSPWRSSTTSAPSSSSRSSTRSGSISSRSPPRPARRA